MRQITADLHIHTYYSDGVFSPSKAVEVSSGIGLSAVSITDHDCIDGLAEAVEKGKVHGVEVIPGLELSSVIESREVHILGYFVDRYNEGLILQLQRMKENRIDRMREIIKLLSDKGLDISEEEVLESSPGGTVGRYHLACFMLRKGLVKSTQEVFDKYIGDGKECMVNHKRLEYAKAINIIKSSGGVPVLAHPGTPNVDRYIPAFIEAGIRGLEVYHSKHSRREIDKYLKIADQNGLLVTGGSDCHGSDSGEALIGTSGVGSEEVKLLRNESIAIQEQNI